MVQFGKKKGLKQCKPHDDDDDDDGMMLTLGGSQMVGFEKQRDSCFQMIGFSKSSGLILFLILIISVDKAVAPDSIICCLLSLLFAGFFILVEPAHVVRSFAVISVWNGSLVSVIGVLNGLISNTDVTVAFENKVSLINPQLANLFVCNYIFIHVLFFILFQGLYLGIELQHKRECGFEELRLGEEYDLV